MANTDTESILAQRRSGREVWREPGISGLNRLPVISLKPRILGKTVADERLPWPLDDICERLLVDGSLASYNKALLDNVIDCRKGFFAQDFEDGVTRKFEQIQDEAKPFNPKAKWRITEVRDYGTEDETEVTDGDLPPGGQVVDSKVVWNFPNGRGLLYDVQEKYDVLESICTRLDDQMSGAALALIVLGFTGEWETAKAELSSGPRIANFPGRNVTVQRVGSTAVIDHLISEFELHYPLYQRLTYWLDTTVGANTSGTAWSIRLEEVHYFVQLQQTNLKRIAAELGGGELKFANYQIRSADERSKDFALLKDMRDIGMLTDEELKTAALELLP